MYRCPDLIHRAVRQMLKANKRGDPNTALRWIIIAERQLDIIDRLRGVDVNDRRIWRVRHLVVAALEDVQAVLSPERSP